MVVNYQEWRHGPERELVPGTLRGYRQVRVESSMIRSPSKPYTWLPGENVAGCNLKKITSIGECGCDTNSNGFLIGRHCGSNLGATIATTCGNCGENFLCDTSPRHPSSAPQRDCVCGFYGAYNLHDLFDAPGVSWSHHYMICVAVVEAYGKIILSTKGFRAEKMKIVALAPYKRDEHHYLCARRSGAGVGLPEYGIDVVRTPEALLRRYPQQDLSNFGVGRVRVDMEAERLWDNIWKNAGKSIDRFI